MLKFAPKTSFVVRRSRTCLVVWSRTKKNQERIEGERQRVSIGRSSFVVRSRARVPGLAASPLSGERSPVNRAGHGKVHAKGSNRFSMRRCLVVGLEGGDDPLRTERTARNIAAIYVPRWCRGTDSASALSESVRNTDRIERVAG